MYIIFIIFSHEKVKEHCFLWSRQEYLQEGKFKIANTNNGLNKAMNTLLTSPTFPQK